MTALEKADGPPEGSVDLGGGHWYTRVENKGEWVGIYEWHRTPRGDWCVGLVRFAGSQPTTRTTWDVQSRDPLTLSPSLLCDCGSHGFIRDGVWVDA